MKYLPQNKLADWRRENTPKWCPITESSVDSWVVDHAHPNQGGNGKIRGVISNSANTILGKAEQHYATFMKGKTQLTLADILRNCADYLEGGDTGILHPTGVSELLRKFKQMKKHEQEHYLHECGYCEETIAAAKNKLDRAKLMRKYLTQ